VAACALRLANRHVVGRGCRRFQRLGGEAHVQCWLRAPAAGVRRFTDPARSQDGGHTAELEHAGSCRTFPRGPGRDHASEILRDIPAQRGRDMRDRAGRILLAQAASKIRQARY
jgi:hypothetical protein